MCVVNVLTSYRRVCVVNVLTSCRKQECVCSKCVDKLQETGGCVCDECVDAVQEAMELEAMMEELLWEGRVSECCHLARLLGGQCTDLIVVLVSLQPSEW